MSIRRNLKMRSAAESAARKNRREKGTGYRRVVVLAGRLGRRRGGRRDAGGGTETSKKATYPFTLGTHIMFPNVPALAARGPCHRQPLYIHAHARTHPREPLETAEDMGRFGVRRLRVCE